MGVPVRKPVPPERQVQRACIQWMRLVLPLGSVVAAIPGEQGAASGATERQRARFGMARKASGIVTGLPDCVVALPGGACLWVEFKAAGGAVSDRQDGLHQRMRSLGHTVLLATSIETCRHGLLAAGVPLREAAGQAVAPPRVRVAKAKARMPADAVPF